MGFNHSPFPPQMQRSPLSTADCCHDVTCIIRDKVHIVLMDPESFPQGSDPLGLLLKRVALRPPLTSPGVSPHAAWGPSENAWGMPGGLARPVRGSKQPCQEPVSTGALRTPQMNAVSTACSPAAAF